MAYSSFTILQPATSLPFSTILYGLMLGLPIWQVHRQLEVLRFSFLIKELRDVRYIKTPHQIMLQRKDGKKFRIITREEDISNMEQHIAFYGEVDE